MQDTCHVALVDSLESQGGNQGGTDTATILGRKNLDRVLFPLVLLGGPVEDLSEGLGSSGLEEGVFIEDGTVGTHVTAVVVLLLANSSDTTG